MPPTTQGRNFVTANLQNDVYFVFEDPTNGDVKLNKTTRAQIDIIVNANQQLQLITGATTIVNKAGYGGGVIASMRLNADTVTGAVRLVIGLQPKAQGTVDVYIGRIDSGNFVQCATINIDGSLIEAQHVNGNARQVNVLRTQGGTIYVEGH